MAAPGPPPGGLKTFNCLQIIGISEILILFQNFVFQQQVQNFGEPFFLVIHEGETLAEVKERIQRKLQVPDEEFSKVFLLGCYHFILLGNSLVNHVFDIDPFLFFAWALSFHLACYILICSNIGYDFSFCESLFTCVRNKLTISFIVLSG